jgi:hypothetical protein
VGGDTGAELLAAWAAGGALAASFSCIIDRNMFRRLAIGAHLSRQVRCVAGRGYKADTGGGGGIPNRSVKDGCLRNSGPRRPTAQPEILPLEMLRLMTSATPPP